MASRSAKSASQPVRPKAPTPRASAGAKANPAKAVASKALPDCIELLNGQLVPLRVIVNPRARRISLRLDTARREAVAVSPSARLLPKAAAFAIDRAGWVAAHLAKLPQMIALAPGAVIPLRGVPHKLVMVKGRTPARIEPGTPASIIVAAPDAETFISRVRRFLAAEAKRDLVKSVETHARTLKVAWKSITVKDTTSRWGSCNADGALCFSWRVVLAPPHILDYLAAHETAHLRELNHSKRYWAHVSRCMPDYDRAEAWLRKNGATLHAIGPK